MCSTSLYSTCLHTMLIFTHSFIIDPLTKGGDTLLDLVISEGKLLVVKCLVTECGVDIYGEHSERYLHGIHTCSLWSTHTQTHLHRHM